MTDENLARRLERELCRLAAEVRTIRWYIPAAMIAGAVMGALFVTLLRAATARSPGSRMAAGGAA